MEKEGGGGGQDGGQKLYSIMRGSEMLGGYKSDTRGWGGGGGGGGGQMPFLPPPPPTPLNAALHSCCMDQI